ncbi:ubiE/COQ5 methyltransferase family-domain-containing protein [Dunaliella salina]|uniref:UbiE/COQ5 methyltransferase family-domain-containing protein n=1 Tax=Dunaliella salina TaxID=3046 RepID=A0ABQ7GIX3_DUNSA|nr:ubiE/COQ5 methyltransferase family-domain-containing protein [Dunaliella salina]|eukprot:KAF5834552.1 ubiE/COQ5 methyltransferase family-domain-containing protein [Dunaliella salina]
MNDLMSGGMHRCWKEHGSSGATSTPQSADSSHHQQHKHQHQHQPHAHDTPLPGPGPGSLRGSVTVCDINQDMLAEGKKKAAAAADLAVDEGLHFEVGNAEALEQFRDAQFDAYTIAFGIRNVTDRGAALAEAYRVLKPGGRFLCLEFSQVSQPLLRQMYDAYSFAVIPRIGGLVAGDADSYQYLVESIRQFPDQETFAGMIEDAGFQGVSYENVLGGVVAMHSGYKLEQTCDRWTTF